MAEVEVEVEQASAIQGFKQCRPTSEKGGGAAWLLRQDRVRQVSSPIS